MTVKDIIIRDLTDEDMILVSEWFATRKWRTPPSPNTLPDTGFVAEEKGELLSVCWLYITNSGLGLVDWVATNPDRGIKGLIGLRKTIKHIENISFDRLNVLIHFTGNDKLAKFFNTKCGFTHAGKDNVSVKSLKREVSI